MGAVEDTRSRIRRACGAVAIVVIATGTPPARVAGATDVPLAGTALAVHNRPEPEDVSKRKITWVADDPAIATGARGSSDDPRCVGAGGGGAGGVLRFFSDRSADSTEDTGDIALPCANWTAVGSPDTPKGYLYSDRDQSDGPCRRVMVKDARRIKATCSGRTSPLSYDLVQGVDQGKVATLLRVGAGNRWCTLFDDKNGTNGADGRTFRGGKTPAPLSCPVPFDCGDGILVAGEQCDDGDLDPGDGCDAACQIEAGYQCSGAPSVCTRCGDGILAPGEQCDDGDLDPGDGCDAACQIEPGHACAGVPSVCTPGCGDGMLGGSEECDDGNTAPGDGCAPHCTYEALCLLTNDGGAPALASLVKVAPDGSLEHVSNVTLPRSNAHATRMTTTSCGRRVYMSLDEAGSSAIAGFEVGQDGTLTALPTATGLFRVLSVVCDPDHDLLFALEDVGFSGARISSFSIDPGGALVPVASTFLASAGFDYALYADLHPTTLDLYMAAFFNPPLGATPDTVYLARVTYDAAGNLAIAESYNANTGFPFAPVQVRDLRFTADGGRLALPGFFDSTNLCFAHFDAPGPPLPPITSLNKSCGTPFPSDYLGFVPRPEGGTRFYYQSGALLTAAEFVGTSIVAHSSISPVHATNQLLMAFGGRLLVSLGPGAGGVATYDVAPDLITLTPNDTVSVSASPNSGVLLPCPNL
jgi:cysteine-rich repeat protein